MSLQQHLDRQRDTVSSEEADPQDQDTYETADEVIYTRKGGYTGHRRGERSFGLALTVAVHALIIGGYFIHWGVSYVQQETQTLSVFDVAPPAAPPEPETEIPPGPEQIEREKPLPERERPKIEPPEIRIANTNPISLPDIVPDPGPPVERTTTPESKPAPTAPQVSDAKPTWQGKVLAALNKAKRYPSAAQRSAIASRACRGSVS